MYFSSYLSCPHFTHCFSFFVFVPVLLFFIIVVLPFVFYSSLYKKILTVVVSGFEVVFVFVCVFSSYPSYKPPPLSSGNLGQTVAKRWETLTYDDSHFLLCIYIYFLAFLWLVLVRQTCSSQMLYLSNWTKIITNTETAMLSSSCLSQQYQINNSLYFDKTEAAAAQSWCF